MTRGLGVIAAAFVVALALAPRTADAQLLAGVDYTAGQQTLDFFDPIIFGTQPVTTFGDPMITYDGAGGFTFGRGGFYQLNFVGTFGSFDASGAFPNIFVSVNGNGGSWSVVVINPTLSTVAGNRLISMHAGDTLILTPNGATSVPSGYFCELVITLVAFPPPPPPSSGPPVSPAPPVTPATGPSIMKWRRVQP
jgi:hypothetical protein